MTTPTLFKRTLDRMLNPPMDQAWADALVTIDIQRATIEAQQQHIRELNARIERLQREAGGLHDLFW
jgi:hypothetical protein